MSTMLGMESQKPFGVVEFDYEKGERPPSDALFSVRPLSDNRFAVEHPFHGPRTFGDTSTFSDKYVDAAAVVLLDGLAYLADARKLNRPRGLETRPYASEFSQLSHCTSLGIMGAEFAGGPLDIFDGLFNDASHIHDGHQGDDNYQGHGKEDLHDRERNDFFTRAGFIDRLVREGVLRPNGQGYHFGNTRLYVGTLLDEDEATVRQTFMSNKHPSRRMDNDRFQYTLEEWYLVELYRHRNSKDRLMVPHALINAALDDVQRFVVRDEGEGDQLVFSTPEIAAMVARAYGEFNALHWCEPVQDLVNDLLNYAERYFFVCDDDLAKDMQYFYPRDYLHTSASLMYEYYYEVAQNDPFMNWLLTKAEQLASDQKAKMSRIIDGESEYQGPDAIDGVSLAASDLSLPAKEDYAVVKDGKLEMFLPKGKFRKVNPRVITGKSETSELSAIMPEIDEELKALNAWISHYKAEIELKPEEVGMVEAGFSRIREGWPRALRRMPMPKGEFRRNIERANKYVRSGGKL